MAKLQKKRKGGKECGKKKHSFKSSQLVKSLISRTEKKEKNKGK